MKRHGVVAALVDALSSLKLTIVCLVLLILIVIGGTIAQVPLGIHAAVESIIRSFFVWWGPADAGWKIPVFPGGGLVGAVLLVNLIFAQFRRLELSWKKGGLWFIHLGLALLFIGEFATAMFQVESAMPLEVGQTRSYSEDYRRVEVAVVDDSGKDFDDVFSIPDSLLRPGKTISAPGLPFSLKVHAYHVNANLGMRSPSDPPGPATVGVGARMTFEPAPPVTADNEIDSSVALIEPVLPGGESMGVYLLSNALGAPQGFLREGRHWSLSLRKRRYYHPFSVTLKEFRHDVYPGTDIPKNFSSLVRLKDARSGDDRDALIYMNAPLRHAGLTLYQASFGKNDTLSVLQVVRNPSWTWPYAACLLVAFGLLWHFYLSLRRSFSGGAP